MRVRDLLLQSAAVLALTIGTAEAAAPTPMLYPEWFFSVEGGALMAAPTVSTSQTTDKVGGTNTGALPPRLSTDTGYYGGLTFGKQATSDVDWRVSLAYSKFNDNRATTNPATLPKFVTITSQLEFGTADFELGRRLPEGDIRLFAGLRALYSRDSADKVGYSDLGFPIGLTTYQGSAVSQFYGAGPRIGLDFEHKQVNGPWGVSGMVAGSAIVGYWITDNYLFGTPLAPTEGTRTVLNAEGSIGLDYHFSPASKLTVGVRGQEWVGLRAGSTGSLSVNPNVLNWGPFVKFVIYGR